VQTGRQQAAAYKAEGCIGDGTIRAKSLEKQRGASMPAALETKAFDTAVPGVPETQWADWASQAPAWVPPSGHIVVAERLIIRMRCNAGTPTADDLRFAEIPC
jgi:hypothetical protein